MPIARLRGDQLRDGILRDGHIAPDAQINESKLSINWNAHTETLQDKKVIFKNQFNDITVGGLTEIDVTSLVNGASVNSNGTAEGIITDAPKNKVTLRDGVTVDTPLKDAHGHIVFGRMVNVTSKSVTGESLAGVKDGVNKLFTFANKPVVSGSEKITKNSTVLVAGTDYTMDYANGTVTLAVAPVSTDTVVANYSYSVNLFVVKFFTDENGVETAFTMATGQTIDGIYYKRGNLLNIPEDYAITSGGSFVEGATDAVAQFDLTQLAKEIGVTLGHDGNMTLTRSLVEEILVQTRGAVNSTVRASAVIDEVVNARNGKASIGTELTAIRQSVSDETTARIAGDDAIRADLGSNTVGKGAGLVGTKNVGETVQAKLDSIDSSIASLQNGGSATGTEVETARTSDITGAHTSLDGRLEAGEARFEAVKKEVESARGSMAKSADGLAQKTFASLDARLEESEQDHKNLVSDLKSTVSGKGASLIAIEDIANVLASTNVEGALKELYDKLVSEQTARTDADSALNTRVTALEAEASKIHAHDRMIFQALGNETSVALPTGKTADPNTLIVSINGLENAVGIHYSEVKDVNGNITGIDFAPDKLVAGDVVILKWLNTSTKY